MIDNHDLISAIIGTCLTGGIAYLVKGVHSLIKSVDENSIRLGEMDKRVGRLEKAIWNGRGEGGAESLERYPGQG